MTRHWPVKSTIEPCRGQSTAAKKIRRLTLGLLNRFQERSHTAALPSIGVLLDRLTEAPVLHAASQPDPQCVWISVLQRRWPMSRLFDLACNRSLALISVGIIMALVCSAMSSGMTYGRFDDRDKTGTTRYNNAKRLPQLSLQQPFTLSVGNNAERGGFEPPVSVNPHWFSKPAQSATLSPLRQGRQFIASTYARQATNLNTLPLKSPWNTRK